MASKSLTVSLTSSEPASASSLTCATVALISAVGVLVMDCMTMGWSEPINIVPIEIVGVFLLMIMVYILRCVPSQ